MLEANQGRISGVYEKTNKIREEIKALKNELE